MPTYEYACRDCGEHLEVVQSFKDAPLSECGRCGGALRKVFSAAGIIFKGSGYYVTDSRKPAPSGDGSSSKSSDTSSSDKGTGGDTKSTAAAASKSDSAPASDPSAKSA